MHHASKSISIRVGILLSWPIRRLKSYSSCRITTTTNCDASVTKNQGCSTQSTTPGSYGQAFNAANGGWYVMQKTASQGISVWFWPRQSSTVPNEVKYGSNSLSPSINSWGLPNAQFPTTDCDYNSHFNAHAIIFDLTLCVSVIYLLTYE